MPRIQHKRGTSANLASVNPTPLAGELVWDSTENAVKIGDGATAWSSLAYVTATPRSHVHDGGDITTGTVAYARLPVGSTTSTVCAGDDARLSNDRTPTAHASTHATGGSDALSPSDIGAAPAASPTFTGDVTIDDKIVHAGDTNTFIRFGAADTFSITTAGTTRLHCDSSGRVGIQNSSPVVTLDVGGPIAARSLITAHQTSAAIFDFASGAARIRAYGATAGSGVIDFRTGGGGDSADAQAMRIDASQNVGIGTGTASAASRLEVNGVITVSAGSAAAPALVASGDSNTGLLWPAADTVAISTAGVERVRVDSSGYVGIGTTSPSTLLDINADKIRLRTAKTPASASDTGNAGDICWDASYLYICTATNTWRRIAHSTW